jgi:hypothetical protein
MLEDITVDPKQRQGELLDHPQVVKMLMAVTVLTDTNQTQRPTTQAALWQADRQAAKCALALVHFQAIGMRLVRSVLFWGRSLV